MHTAKERVGIKEVLDLQKGYEAVSQVDWFPLSTLYQIATEYNFCPKTYFPTVKQLFFYFLKQKEQGEIFPF